MLRTRLAVERDLVRELVPILVEHVGQQVGAGFAGTHECLRIARGGHPDGQLRLHRRRIDAQPHRLADAVRRIQRAAAPQMLDGAHRGQHVVLPGRIFVRGEHEVVRIPSGGERHAHAAVRQVVHHRPFFRDPDRVVQRGDHAARDQLHALGGRGERGVQDGGIRVKRAEFGEMALRHPDAGEPVRIGETRALHHELVLVAGQRLFTAGEEHQSEFHAWLRSDS